MGTYVITPSGAAEQGNYTVTYQTGTFTIKEITYSVSGSFDGSGKLVATVTAPKGSVLIAAAYEAGGRMAGTKSFAITAAVNNGTHTFDTLAMASGNTYKIMLVDKTTYAPLCAAWGN